MVIISGATPILVGDRMECERQHEGTESLLEYLTRSLSGEALNLAVDARLDAAADCFEPNPTAAGNAQAFRREIARFVQHLSLSGLFPAQRLTEASAFGEAIELLAAAYFTNRDNGLAEAEADVTGEKPDALHRLLMRAFGAGQPRRPDVMAGGLDALHRVLATILEEAKQRRRSEYFEWIIARTIDSLDGRQRCRLADAIRSIYGDDLPNNMANWPSGRLAIHLCGLLGVHLRAIQSEGQLLRTRRFL